MANGANFSILADVELNLQSIQQQLKKHKITFDIDGKSIKVAGTDLDDLTKKVKNADDGSKQLSKTNDELAESITNAALSYQAANAILQKSLEIIGAMVDQVYELDGAMTDFKKVSDLSGASLDNYVSKLAEMGGQVARTGSEMVEAATEFRKSGFNDEDAANLAMVASQLQNVADDALSAGEASNFIIAQMKAFGIEADNSQHIIDALNEVSNRFAVSSSDLSNNIGKASAAMATGNTTYEETLGLFTSITEITRNASRAARGD